MLQWSVPSAISSMITNTVYNGTGIIQKTGAGTLGNGNNNFNVNMAAGGVFDEQAGDINFGGGHTIFGSNLGSLNVASGASFHISDTAVQFDALTGSGSINNAYNNSTPTLTIGAAGTTNNATYGVVGNSATFSGVIGYAQTYNTVSVGTMNLVKAGNGTQVLSGFNGYTGTTAISGGTLQIGGAGYLGGGNYAGAISNSGAFVMNSSANQTLAGAITGSGALYQLGSGQTTLTASNSYTGVSTVGAGVLEFGQTGAMYAGNSANWTTTNLVVQSGATMALAVGATNGFTAGNVQTIAALGTAAGGFKSGSLLGLDTSGGNFSYGNVIANPNSGANVLGLVKLGGNTLTLSTNNTYTGTTTVNGGTLSTTAGNTGTGAVGSSSAVIVNNGAAIAVSTGGDNSFVGYTTSSSKTITINAGGLITDGGANSNHLNALVLNGGTLSAVTPDGSYGNWNFDQGVSTPGSGRTSYISGGNALLTQAGGTLFNVGAGDTINVSTVLAHISGQTDNGLVKSGPGSLLLTAADTYTSNTSITAGTLAVSGTGSLNSGSYAAAIANSGALAINTSTAQTLGGAITGSGSLTEAGPAMLTLSNAGDTYSGATNVSGGTLLLSGATPLPNSTLSLGAAGVFSTLDGRREPPRSEGLSMAGGAKLTMDWGDTLSTSATATTAGTVNLVLPNSGFTSGTQYTLIQAGGGLGTAANYNVFLPNAANYSAALSVSATGVTLTPTAATALTTAYWYGGQVPGAPAAMALSGGTASNWSAGPSYTVTGLVPGASTNVVFSTSTGATQQANVVLGANTTINSLTFSDTNAVTIGGDGYTLTLASSGTGASSAINVNQNATIGTNVALNAAQTVTINSGALTLGGSGLLNGGNYAGAIVNNSALVMNSTSAGTLSGVISGTGALNQLGSGLTTLTGSNIYTGNTTVGANTLQMGAGGTTGMVGPGTVAVASGATFEVNRSDNMALANSLSGAGTFYKQGSNTLTYSGTSTALSGTIRLAGGAFTVAPGASITNVGTATQDNATAATWNVNGTLGATTVSVAPGGGSWSSATGVVNVNSGGSMTATTMNLSDSGRGLCGHFQRHGERQFRRHADGRQHEHVVQHVRLPELHDNCQRQRNSQREQPAGRVGWRLWREHEPPHRQPECGRIAQCDDDQSFTVGWRQSNKAAQSERRDAGQSSRHEPDRRQRDGDHAGRGDQQHAVGGVAHEFSDLGRGHRRRRGNHYRRRRDVHLHGRRHLPRHDDRQRRHAADRQQQRRGLACRPGGPQFRQHGLLSLGCGRLLQRRDQRHGQRGQAGRGNDDPLRLQHVRRQCDDLGRHPGHWRRRSFGRRQLCRRHRQQWRPGREHRR